MKITNMQNENVNKAPDFEENNF